VKDKKGIEVDFERIDCWFSELPASVQSSLKQLHPPLEQLPLVILPADQGPDIETQLRHAEVRFELLASSGRPFYLARVSDCELAALGWGYLPHSPHPLPEREMFRSCGFDRGFLPYRSELIQCFREADLLGLQQNWHPWRANTAALFAMLGIPVPPPNGVEIHLPYKMLVDGSLFRFLRGKHLLLIGGLAKDLATAWWEPAFARSYRRFGCLEQVSSVAAIRMARRGEGRGAWADIERVYEEASRLAFDVALLSAGVPAKILARRLRDLGKVALDVGFVFDALLGDPERKLRPALRDAEWPERTT
jgi:hypothetical protein